MSILKKNEDKEKNEKVIEPQYYMSAVNVQTLNYKVYYMSKKEKIMYFIIAFIVGAFVGYLFYGGIGKDEFGQRTAVTWFLDITISMALGLISGKLFLPMRTKSLKLSRQKKLKSQFRDMLEALTTSLNAGKNVVDSFQAVYEDLKVQYEEDVFILKELEIILAGMANNIPIEDMLADFGMRSGVDDIVSFANVFDICYRKGGNIKDTIRNTHEIISDKMTIMEDIETVVTSTKSEQNMMIMMPVLLVGMIKMTSADFANNFVTPAGIMSTTIAIVLFVIAYVVGKKILDIKI